MVAVEQVIIVTGASKGIGLAIAKYLLHSSINVVLVARSREPLETLKAEFPDRVQLAVGALGDADFGLERSCVDLARSKWGRVDGLIVNHGTLQPVQRIRYANIQEWTHIFNVNLLSAVALVKAALPALRTSTGRVIFTSTGAAVTSYSAMGAYGASKAALNHLAQTIAVEEPEVTCVAIRPGVVDTDMQTDLREKYSSMMDDKDAAKFSEAKEKNKLLTPEQPGHVIAQLSLTASNQLSGRFLSWDDEALAEYQKVLQ